MVLMALVTERQYILSKNKHQSITTCHPFIYSCQDIALTKGITTSNQTFVVSCSVDFGLTSAGSIWYGKRRLITGHKGRGICSIIPRIDFISTSNIFSVSPKGPGHCWLDWSSSHTCVHAEGQMPTVFNVDAISLLPWHLWMLLLPSA